LLIDAGGNLYGVTAYGGTGPCVVVGGLAGCGTVYEVNPPAAPGGSWTKTTLYSFQGGSDGELAQGDLVFDKAGNLYGATQYGAGYGSCNAPFYTNCGIIFELSPPKTKGGDWTEKVLYSFKSGNDGANPNGGLIFDQLGAIYGTTYFGGVGSTDAVSALCKAAGGIGCGTVFKLVPGSGAWTEIVLYRFDIFSGASPSAGLVADEDSNLYGTTGAGGIDFDGIIFRLAVPSKPGEPWKESVVFSFGGPHGIQPMASLTLKNGALYGAASGAGVFEAGTIFRLERGSEKVTPHYSVRCDFAPGDQAAAPESTLTFDNNGAIYGTTLNYRHLPGGAVFTVNP